MGQRTVPAIGADVSALMPAVGEDVSDWMSAPDARSPDRPMDLRAVLGRLGGGAAEMLNPVDLAQGAAHALRHPLDTGEAIVQGMLGQAGQARTAFDQGQYGDALGRLLAAGLPIIGPAAATIGEAIAGGGDIPTNIGRALGLATPIAGPGVLRGAAKMGRLLPLGTREALAEPVAAAAARRLEDVMSPTVGAQKTRFGGLAERVAPELVKTPEASAWSRGGLQANVEGLYERGQQALDAAADARLAARTFDTQPLIDGLRQKRRRLTAETVQGSQPAPKGGAFSMGPRGIERAGPQAQALGTDVVPGPNAARVAMIDQAIGELQQLGPVTRYDPIRVMRHAYDQPAKIKYVPSMTADFLKKTGEAAGAADVTDILRTHLGTMDPGTAAANAAYSLARGARDVLKATEEVERTRPKVGRQIIARLTGTIAGGHAAGFPGAVGGYLFGPVVDAAIQSGLTTQLKTAHVLTEMATAIRRGDLDHVSALQMRLSRRVGVQSALALGREDGPEPE